MATMNVKDAAGDTVAIEKPLAPGREAAADSRPVALSDEDLAAINALGTKLDEVKTLTGAVDETAPVSDTASSGLNGRMQRLAQRFTALIALLPTALGSAAASASLAVTASTEDIARIGATNESAAASDTATSGLNGLLKRIAQRLSSLIALVPAALTGSGNFKTAVAEALPAGTNNIGDVDIVTVPADPFGANSDAASATGSISAKLRAIATALGVTALDLGAGTGGSRTLRFARDTAQWVGGSGANGSAVQRMTVATDDTLISSLATKLDTLATKLDEGRAREVQVVFTCDAAAVAQYEVLAATEVLTNLAPANDVLGCVRKITAVRLDSTTGFDFRLWLLRANSAVGNENAAFAPADADVDDIIDFVDFVAADFVGTTGMVNGFAKKDVEIWCRPASGTRNVYAAIQAMGSGGVDLGAATDLVVTFQAL